MQTGVMQSLRWMRMAGDTVFAIGALVIVYFIIDLIFRRPKSVEAVVTTLAETA
jgi:nitric oxide reductase large subunit